MSITKIGTSPSFQGRKINYDPDIKRDRKNSKIASYIIAGTGIAASAAAITSAVKKGDASVVARNVKQFSDSAIDSFKKLLGLIKPDSKLTIVKDIGNKAADYISNIPAQKQAIGAASLFGLGLVNNVINANAYQEGVYRTTQAARNEYRAIVADCKQNLLSLFS